MVLVSLADGVVQPAEIATIQRAFAWLARREIGEAEIRAEIEAALADGRPLTAFLNGAVAAQLNDEGKELVLRAAFLVAAADRIFEAREWQVLGEIGHALQMTPAHYQRVIDSLWRGQQAA